MELRPYQLQAIDLLVDGFKKGHQRQVLCLPTGSGKTVTFAEMITRAARKGTRSLILTDRIELFQQSFAAIKRTGIHPEVLQQGSTPIPAWSLVTLAMVETLYRRYKKIELDPQLIIIDEAHKGNFSKVIDLYPHCKVIGATATPIGKHFHKYYTNIVNNIGIQELIDQDYLVMCRPFEMQADLSDLETKNGEYTDASLYTHYSKTILFDGVIQSWLEKAKGTKTLCFNVNIKHAEETTAAFKEAGIVSDCVTSNTSTYERKRILDAFKEGYIQVLNNCGVLTTGYDEPSIETIIMNRATLSLPLFLQCLGRGSRPNPGKDYFTVLDFGLNHSRLGMWNEDRKWSLSAPKNKSKREGIAPQKICPKCSALLPASARVCDFCDHEFLKELAEGELVEVTQIPKVPPHLVGRKISECSVEELIELLEVGRYRFAFITRILRTQGEDALREFGRLKGYKSGWVYNQLQNKDAIGFNDVIIR